MRFYTVGQTCSHHSFHFSRWSYFTIFSILLDLLDRIRGGYFQLVFVLPPNATWTSHFRSRS